MQTIYLTAQICPLEAIVLTPVSYHFCQFLEQLGSACLWSKAETKNTVDAIAML